MERMRKSVLFLAEALLLTLVTSALFAQASKSKWTTHEEIREWLGFPDGVPAQGLRGVTELSEGSRDFIRIRWSELNTSVDWLNGGELPIAEQPALIDPQLHNALRVVLRHTMGVGHLSGLWFHRAGKYDESYRTVPIFDPQSAPGDGEWHEVILKFSDSAFFDPADDILLVMLGVVPADPSIGPEQSIANLERAIAGDGFLDIDEIEAINTGELILPLQISDFNPKKGDSGDEITILGQNFAAPPESNVVMFGNVPGNVLSGTESTLVVEARGSGTVTLSVRAPGAGRAEAPQPFVFFGLSTKLVVVLGDAQTAQVESVLEPIVVKLMDKEGNGLPLAGITFSVQSGSANLSASEVITSDDGTASVTVTLGNEPGTVQIKATSQFFTVIVTAVVTL